MLTLTPSIASGTNVLRWLFLLLVASTLMALGTAHQASGVDNGEIGIRPAYESDFFHLSLYPGSAAEATAIVSNSTAEPVTLQTYPVDAVSRDGGFAVADQGAPREGVGAWIEVAEQTIVPPHSEVAVQFRLTVPPGTPPGDYAGAMIIQAPPVIGDLAELADGTAVRLDTVQRQGVRIYLDVAGTAVTSIGHGELSWEEVDGQIVFTLPLRNTGNTSLNPTVDLDLNSWPGSPRSITFDAPGSILPGGTHMATAALPFTSLAMFGDSTATIRSEAGVDTVAAQILYVPAVILAIGTLVCAAVAFGAWRISRFVRRARYALAQLAPDSPAQWTR
ncbi:MAG: DUF916 domain-containing protein [Homoserinimonas sp.]